MDRWVEAVKKELGLEIEIDKDLILDVARDVAHAIERPATPVTTYLLGYAVARGADLNAAVSTIEKLAKQWTEKNNHIE